MNQAGIPNGAAIAIGDLLDHCGIKPGQEVLIMAQIDGLHGGDNVVDSQAISWIQSAIQFRGANPSVLWIDEASVPHHWRFPPMLKAALSACDIFINNSFDLTIEENYEYRKFIWERKIPAIRNFATTAPLLCTAWAQTPDELVSEIRYQASLPFKDGLDWQLTDANGTHLEGTIISPAYNPSVPWASEYSTRREEAGYNRPWPEWMLPPIKVKNAAGIFIFDRMLSWWSRYIGISPYFSKAIKLTIENSRIIGIEGGNEADSLKRFLAMMQERLGDGVYNFNALHFGVHPQAEVSPHQCPNLLHRRLIEHSHCSNIHIHIGAPAPTSDYPYWMHCTGDIRTATFRAGNVLVHDRGHLTALDHPAVRIIAAKYPGRPGLEPVPMSS